MLRETTPLALAGGGYPQPDGRRTLANFLASKLIELNTLDIDLHVDAVQNGTT